MPTKHLPLAQLASIDAHLLDEEDFENHPEADTLAFLLASRKFMQHRAVVAAIRVLRRSAAGLEEPAERLCAACNYMEDLSSGLGVMPGDHGAELGSILATARMKLGPRK